MIATGPNTAKHYRAHRMQRGRDPRRNERMHPAQRAEFYEPRGDLRGTDEVRRRRSPPWS